MWRCKCQVMGGTNQISIPSGSKPPERILMKLGSWNQCSNYRGDEGISPTVVLDLHLIHGVEDSALSAPRRPPPTAFS